MQEPMTNGKAKPHDGEQESHKEAKSSLPEMGLSMHSFLENKVTDVSDY